MDYIDELFMEKFYKDCSLGELASIQKYTKGEAENKLRKLLNKPDKFGQMPLVKIAQLNRPEVLYLILPYIQDIDAKTNNFPYTPLQIVVDESKTESVLALLKAGADPNLQTEEGDTALHFARKKEIIFSLVRGGARLDIENNDGLTPIQYAIFIHNHEGIQAFLDCGNDIHYRSSSDGKTLIQYAVMANDIYALALLEQNGADIDELDERGFSPLSDAVIKGQVKMVEALLKLGVNAEFSPDCDCGVSPLHYAVETKNLEIVKLLIQAGADVNVKRNGDKFTPLHIACQNEDEKMVDFLANLSTIEINSKNVRGDTPLHISVRDKTANIPYILIENGAEIEAQNREGQTPLHYAVIETEKVQAVLGLFLDFGANIDKTDKNGKSAFLYACEWGRQETSKTLLSRGADPHLVDKEGNNSAYYAVIGGKLEILKTIKELGVDIEKRNKKGQEPLHIACLENKESMIFFLLDAGVGVNFKTKSGNMPLHLATIFCSERVVEKLIQEGAHINTFNKSGLTPLHIASLRGKERSVRLLLKKGADVNFSSEEGNNQSPLHLAALYGQEKIVKILLDAGANPYTVTKKGSDSELFASIEGYKKIVSLIEEAKKDCPPETKKIAESLKEKGNSGTRKK